MRVSPGPRQPPKSFLSYIRRRIILKMYNVFVYLTCIRTFESSSPTIMIFNLYTYIYAYIYKNYLYIYYIYFLYERNCICAVETDEKTTLHNENAKRKLLFFISLVRITKLNSQLFSSAAQTQFFMRIYERRKRKTEGENGRMDKTLYDMEYRA